MKKYQKYQRSLSQKKIEFLFAILITITSALSCESGNDKNNQSEESTTELSESKILKEIIAYSENPYTKPGYEDIKTFYYGLYISLPEDTTGVAKEIMNLLHKKSENAGENDVIHFWVFTDSTLVPKSFDGDWSTEKSRKKCFAHAVKLANGNFSYDYDMFGEYQP